jgi:hypothetical protein
MLPIKNGLEQRDSLLRMLFNFRLEHAIKRIWGNQEGLKLNGTYQLLVYAYNVHILGSSTHTIKKNTQPLVVASKEIGLEVNADKTKYKVISQDQNAGKILIILIINPLNGWNSSNIWEQP